MNAPDQKTNRPAEEEIVLNCRGIVKQFPGNLALDHVDFSVRRGEVHALVGQNGAGKSTLVKIITGVYTRDGGVIELDGTEMPLRSPTEAEEAGISIIHQDQQLVHNFDVKRNVFLGREIRKGPFLDFDTMRKQTQEVLDMIHVRFGPDDLIKTLSVGEREQVSIAAALLQKPRILILDEPTASLSLKETEQLFQIIRDLKSQGVTIIYISHHFDEIFEVSDRITVLRDGKSIQTLNVKDCNKREVIEIMIGRNVSQLYPKKEIEKGKTILSVKNISLGNKLNDVSFELKKGEIIGVAGILGSGIADLANVLFGIVRPDSGEISVYGRQTDIKNPRIAKQNRLALIPEDRRTEGFVSGMTVEENMSFAFAKRYRQGPLYSRKKGAAEADRIIRLLSIKTNDCNTMIDSLSGGNQQKVVIGKWLEGDSGIFIMNQPTTGVDVGSKVEIYNAISDLVADGAGAILISQDFEELLGMCDRIIVISGGAVTKIYQYGEAEEKDLLHYATVSVKAGES